MTPDEVIDLLTLVAAADKRTVGQADVEVWREVADADGWTFTRARRALFQHLRRDTTMVKPAHINAIINDARREARSRFTEDVSPPRELADDPAAEIAWRRQRASAWIEHALDVWADTGTVPNDLPQRRELGEFERPELLAAVDRFEDRRAIPVGRERAPAANSPERAEHRAAALAELDRRRPVLDAIRTSAVSTPREQVTT